MDYKIREINKKEIPLLKNFTYEAIFIRDGEDIPPFSIVEAPELKVYYETFGQDVHDHAVVAESDGVICGACWVRIMNDYGHVDDETPSFAVSLYKKYRGHGMGTAMMRKMLGILKKNGYKKASLSCQKDNYAVKMYRKLGFEIIDENEEEYIMVISL